MYMLQNCQLDNLPSQDWHQRVLHTGVVIAVNGGKAATSWRGTWHRVVDLQTLIGIGVSCGMISPVMKVLELRAATHS